MTMFSPLNLVKEGSVRYNETDPLRKRDGREGFRSGRSPLLTGRDAAR